MARLSPSRRSIRFGPPKFSPSTSVVSPVPSALGRMVGATVSTADTGEEAGFGRLGLRTGLRPFADLVVSSAWSKRPLLEVRPKLAVTGWSLYSGNAYQTPFYRAFYNFGEQDPRNDIIRDVVAVQSSLDAGLRRAESIADVVATAGTYYYDYTEALGSARWDDGVSIWDNGVLVYDAFPKLYVHLEDNSSPSNTNVVAALGFYFSTIAATHPILGDNKLVQTTASLSPAAIEYHESPAAIAGAYYRFSGYYQTTPGTSAGIVVNDGVGKTLLSDGRNTTTGANTMALDDTAGETRSFTFDFISPGSTIVAQVLYVAGGGTVTFTKTSLRRIFRYNFYEPRLGSGMAPAYTGGLNDALFGGSRVGVGQAQILNGDGSLESDLGDLVWTNAEARGYIGGAFHDGTQLDISDYQRAFNGAVQDVTGGDQAFFLSMEDLKTFYNTVLPAGTYDKASLPNMDTDYDGKPRPLLFGTATNLTPIRFDTTAANAYGRYEIADSTDSPAGMAAINALYAYDTETAARELDATKRILLVGATDYTTNNLDACRFRILRDVGPYIVDATNNKLNFDIGAAELTATITVGVYTATTLAAEIQTQLRAAVGGGDVTMTCTYSDTTHKFTIAKSAGTLNLRTSNGTNKDISGYTLVGFHKDANKTGSLSYLGDDATFTSADKDHILRVDAQGYIDDALGTFTGTASALIQTGPDIVRYIMRRLLKKPTSIIDSATFAAARSTCPQLLGAYLAEQVTVRSFLDKIEWSTLATISVDGSGTVYYDPYVSSPSPLVALADSDYLSFSVARKASDIFQQVVVRYSENRTLSTWQTVSQADSSVGLKYGRLDTRTVDTFLTSRGDAVTTAQQLLRQFNGTARRITISVKGKLITLRLGQAVALTRTRSLTPALSSTVFRIVSVRHSYDDGVTQAELLEAV